MQQPPGRYIRLLLLTPPAPSVNGVDGIVASTGLLLIFGHIATIYLILWSPVVTRLHIVRYRYTTIMQQLQKRALSHHRRATIALNTRSCSLERKFVCKRLVAPAAPADHPDSDSSTRTDGAPAVTDRDMLWDLCTGHWRTQGTDTSSFTKLWISLKSGLQ